MLKLKSCPRCKGDLRIDRDQFGWFEECIQCGYVRDLVAVADEQITKPKKDLPAKRTHHPPA